MKKKNFLSGISAKLALLTLAISGALMTGCYKDDGLDVTTPGGGGQVLDNAVYTITGTVTDAESGENIKGNVSYTDGTSQTLPFDGTYTIKIAKFTEDVKTLTLKFKADDASYNGGKEIVRTVVMNKIEDGNAVVYPVNVAMKKSATAMKARPYNLSFVYKNAVTGEQISEKIDMTVRLNNVTEITSFTELAAGDYTILTQPADKYKSSITLLSLPYVESEKGEVINKTVEILINPIDPEKEDTYTTLAGVIVDKNGNSLLAEKIELMKDGVAINERTIVNSTNFVFTVNDKEKGDYTIKATVKDLAPVNSGVYSIPACGNQNITIVIPESAEVKTYVMDYVLTFVYKNALTGEAISETIKHTSQPAVTNDIYKAGEYAITTEATSNFKSSVTHVTLEEVKSTDPNAKASKVIVIALTPVDSNATFTTLSGTVINDNGQPVMAETIKLLKEDNSVAKVIKNSASFTFVINNEKEAGTYKVETTVKGKPNITSGEYVVPGCGNQVVTVVFENDKPAELTDVVYNLTFKAIDAESLMEINNATFSFNGNTSNNSVNKVNPGTYELYATAAGYYTGKMNIDLPALKNTDGLIEKTIAIYLTKEVKQQITKVVLMGEIVDALGNMIVAQSIKLVGSNSAVYNTNHFSFEVEVPANITKASDLKQWVVTAKVSKFDNNHTPLDPVEIPTSFVYDLSKETTVINKNISIPFTADKDGNIVIDNLEPGDGEQGQVTPDVDPETGKVTEEIKTVMNGNGTADDKTVIIIEKETIIQTSEGAPLTSSIVLTRDVKEEKSPTANEEKEVAQPAVLRSFYGNPDGAKFIGNPLKVTFADPYAGELGTLQLEYKVNGLWGVSVANTNNEVVTNGNEYTMSVSHFSQFRAAVAGTLDNGTIGDNDYGKPYSKEVNRENNTDENQDLKITFKNAPTGAIYQSLDEAIAKVFKNENAQSLIKKTINNIFAARGIAIGSDFEAKDAELAFTVAPYTLVKSIEVKTVYEITTYKFVLNGKSVEVVVKSVLKHNIEAQTVEFGHGHGHGHGGDINAGGGIIVSE